MEVTDPLDVHGGPIRACLANGVGEEVARLSQGIGVQGGGAIRGEGLGVKEQLRLGIKGGLLVHRGLGVKACESNKEKEMRLRKKEDEEKGEIPPEL